MPKNEDLGKILKIAGANFMTMRVIRNESLQKVSKSVKISQALLKNIETGEYDMELCMLLDLCHHYNVSPADVVSENFRHSNV